MEKFLKAPICLAIYGATSFNQEWRSDIPRYATVNPNVPNELKTTSGWNQFAIAFFVGGLGGLILCLPSLRSLRCAKRIIQWQNLIYPKFIATN
jgi:hypothetical protein